MLSGRLKDLPVLDKPAPGSSPGLDSAPQGVVQEKLHRSAIESPHILEGSHSTVGLQVQNRPTTCGPQLNSILLQRPPALLLPQLHFRMRSDGRPWPA